MEQHEQLSISLIRKTHFGRYLFELNKFYTKRSLAYVHLNGFPELTGGYLHILSQVDLDRPTSIQEVIDRVGMPKQAVSRTLLACESLGWIERVRAEGDGRTKCICFSESGRQLMEIAAQAIAETEAFFIEKVGSEMFHGARSQLSAIANILEVIRVDRD